MQLVAPGSLRRLTERGHQKRRVIQDECDQPVSSSHEDDGPSCDAAARDCPVSLVANQELENTQPLLWTEQDISEEVADSQVGHRAEGGKDSLQDKEGFCRGLNQREADLAADCNGRCVCNNEERGSCGVGREEDEVETDEELSEETRGKAREEKGEAGIGQEVETRTGNGKGGPEESLEEEGKGESEDPHDEGKDADNRADDVGPFASAMPSTPPVNQTLIPEKQGEMRSKKGQLRGPNREREISEYQQNDIYSGKAVSSSVTVQQPILSGADGGQAEVDTPTPILRVPPTIQVRGITHLKATDECYPVRFLYNGCSSVLIAHISS